MWRRLSILPVIVLLLLLGSASGRPGWAPARPYLPAYARGHDVAPPPALVTRAVPEQAMHLVDLAEYSPQLVLDIRYATPDNFVGRTLYTAPRALCARGTAAKLEEARLALLSHGYLLVVWDAYRPFSVQQVMWEIWPDAQFVANPNAIGSRHNRGAAVDVTLADLHGKQILMPTDFDHFGPEANPGWLGHPAEVRDRALLLREVMRAAGFLHYAAEWWHFSDEEWARYPLLDLPVDIPVPHP